MGRSMMDTLLLIVVVGSVAFALVVDIVVCVAWIKGQISKG
jgi:hypothetical protein